MEKIKILSKKYDGSLRETYETYLYDQTGEWITLYSPPGLPFWNKRLGGWFETPDGILEIYSRRRWFNLWHIAEQNSNLNRMYVNIALPAQLQDGVLEWVDLDLDYRVHIDGSIEALDEDEFQENARLLGYTAGMIAHSRAACAEVEAGLARGDFPFDHEQQVALYHQVLRGLDGKKPR